MIARRLRAWRAALLPAQGHELPEALRMAAAFFSVITAFRILKPIKKALLLAHYDSSGLALGPWLLSAPQAELVAKVGNVVLACGGAIAFVALASRVPPRRVMSVLAVFFVAVFAVVGVGLHAQSTWALWALYATGDLYSTVMVTALFTMASERATPDSAKRTYGLIGLGGVFGGVLGSAVLASFVSAVDPHVWLLACACLTAPLPWLIGDGAREAAAARVVQARDESARVDARPAVRFRGLQRVLASRYLLTIAGMVTLYEVVSTLLDYQFSASVAHYLDGAAIGAHVSRVFAAMNGVSLLVQLVVTSAVLTRLGVGAALLVLPASALLAATGFLLAPALLTASAIPLLDGGLAYSIAQSAKEALYVPTSLADKREGKAFIDMVLQRAAKLLGVALAFALSVLCTDFTSVRFLSLAVLALGAAWLMLARRAGVAFEALAVLHTRALNEESLPVVVTGRPSPANGNDSLEAVRGLHVVGVRADVVDTQERAALVGRRTLGASVLGGHAHAHEEAC